MLLPARVLTIDYAYDNADRITSMTYKLAGGMLGNLTYSYDAVGRRTGMGGSFAKVQLPQTVADTHYNANNQLDRWNGTPLTYDANGNLFHDGVTTYT